MSAIRLLTLACTLLVATVSLNCNSSSNSMPPLASEDPELPEGEEEEEEEEEEEGLELEILFIGNSLTYSNDLPGLVETIAEASGHLVSTTSVAKPNFSLEDHWRAGILRTVQELRPHLVIMQQGPSSLPDNQVHLANWASVLDETIRAVGGESGLLMVWPSLSRVTAFPAVYDSYRNAAIAANGRFFPAGQAFFDALSLPEIDPFGPDRFHPSVMGSTLAALTIVRTLYPDALEELPIRMVPSDNSNPTVDLGQSAQTVLELVDATVAKHGF